MLSLAGLVAIFVSARDARADDAAESRFFDAIARDAYAHRHWADALAAFLRAHRAAPSSRSLYNIALCAQLAHREGMAFEYFDEFVNASTAPDEASLRADAATRITSLRRTLALVSITTDPPGATIYVDQRDHGSYGTTPRVLALPAGAHHLILDAADHDEGGTDVTATVGASQPVHVDLVAHRGAIALTVTPPDATVVGRRSDGSAALALSPTATTEVPVGRYHVVASAERHHDAEADVTITRGATEHRTLVLEPLPVPQGRLLVTTGDVHARVRVDGVDRAETPARVADLPVGAHEVSVAADGYLPWTGSVDVAEGRTAFVSVTLVPAR